VSGKTEIVVVGRLDEGQLGAAGWSVEKYADVVERPQLVFGHVGCFAFGGNKNVATQEEELRWRS
jgi:hypothetical protein